MLPYGWLCLYSFWTSTCIFRYFLNFEDNLLLFSLFHAAKSYYTQGYLDDIEILILRKDTNPISEIMKRVLKTPFESNTRALYGKKEVRWPKSSNTS